MRSPRQFIFRARQELVNLVLTAHPPAPVFRDDFRPELRLPPLVEAGPELLERAGAILDHRFPIFSATICPGPDIRWRRDYLRGIETGLDYFRGIRYLDVRRAGDHKLIWELNRHQHLIVLAQAYAGTGDARYRDEIRAQLESWLADNPLHRGINWASALEVALRTLSWLWAYQLAGLELPGDFRARWLHAMYLHGCHLANNLSIYFSPNNHLVGEAVVLHALGRFFARYARAAAWEQLGARVVREAMDRQIRADGSSFEQSTYYQGYLVDMFRLHATLANPGAEYLAKLRQMEEFLDAVMGPARIPPMLGDDDGGQLPQFVHGRCRGAGKCESRLFPDAGLAVMRSGTIHAIVDAGPFGALHSGHSHSDTLSIVVRDGHDEILIDPGTYTYTGEPEWRDWFRSSAAHNTIRIDGRDQGEMAGPFRWSSKPEVQILEWRTDSTCDVIEAECRYAGFTHRRRVEFRKPHVFLITDSVDGPPGEHDIEQFWHLGSAEVRSKLVLPADAELSSSWRSTIFGEKHLAPVLRVHRRSTLPLKIEARIDLSR